MIFIKNIFLLFVIFFYSLGTIILPESDFSFLEDLPKMYAHCKATEDIDMTPIDFITDHLINIDGIFDKHLNGDPQKPHKPFELNFHHYFSQFIFEFKKIEFKNNYQFTCLIELKISNYETSNYSFNFIHSIFKPPIVS